MLQIARVRIAEETDLISHHLRSNHLFPIPKQETEDIHRKSVGYFKVLLVSTKASFGNV